MFYLTHSTGFKITPTSYTFTANSHQQFIKICNPLYLIVLFTVLIDLVVVLQSADGFVGLSRFYCTFNCE